MILIVNKIEKLFRYNKQKGVRMALHIDEKGKVEIVTPPKKLSKKEREILDNIKVNDALIKEAINTKFNVVYG